MSDQQRSSDGRYSGDGRNTTASETVGSALDVAHLWIASETRVMDGCFTAIADITEAIGAEDFRLIGGSAVFLHMQLAGITDPPPRLTRDADVGVRPLVLRDTHLVTGVERLGYRKTRGNVWERTSSEGIEASIELLVPAYTHSATTKQC